MSYRTFKRLLGETSLERKCRFLLGGGLFLLISASFLFYGRHTTNMVVDQNRVFGQLLIAPIMYEKHWRYFERDRDEGEFEKVLTRMSQDLKPIDIKDYSWALIKAHGSDPAKGASEQLDHDALAKLALGDDEYTFRTTDGFFRYYGAVRASSSCMACHTIDTPNLKEGDLLGMVKIIIPLSNTERALAWNNAILFATAIGTSFLAWLAAYAIIRYVIVKPVIHLKDVSDSIARGNLDLRADIRTGDEYEELSHAFNRMLRHLVAVQEELRQVNCDLDGKVDELAKVNLTLFEMNNLKSDFMATMSHELRTPLNSILGFSDVLADAVNLDERQHRYVRNIQTSGKDLLVLINDILDLAKIESGRMEIRIVEFSLHDLTERLVNMVRPLSERKNIELTIEDDPQLPLVKQDMGKLQQILYNLLSNAIKFTPEGGRVKVISRRAGSDQFSLIVEDTGVGIALEDQETIFEKFRQGNTALGQRRENLTREFAGTGLGLSIVRELSRLLEGEVTLASELGKGSTFTVTIPIELKIRETPLDSDLDQQSQELNRLRRVDLGLVGVKPLRAGVGS
jgi:two-component system sensor histidine kinase BarA